MKKYFAYYYKTDNELLHIYCKDYKTKLECCLYNFNNDITLNKWEKWAYKTLEEERFYISDCHIKQIPKAEIEKILFTEKL